MWNNGGTISIIKRKHINTYKYKLRDNKVEYSTVAGPYINTHDVKVPFNISELSGRKVITHCFHLDNGLVYAGIGYYTIIGRYLIVKLSLKASFGCQIMEWDNTVIPMKDSRKSLGQPDLTKREIRKGVMQTVEPVSTREYTERFIKILDSTYKNDDLDKVSTAAVQIDKINSKNY